MRLGIDIGGTHTDGVLIADHKIIKTTKLTTNNNLSSNILNTCEKLLRDQDPQNIKQVTLSTTLATNTIIENDYSPTGLILIPGPGLKPDTKSFPTETISGYINHRGQEMEKIKTQEVIKAANNLINSGVKTIAICAKFSTRNPNQELQVKKIIEDNFSNLTKITLSHQLSAKLNFPRRKITTYFNSALIQSQQEFIANIKSGLQNLNISAPIFLLKADGGTMNLKQAQKLPVETINSGPSASIMGILALTEAKKTTLGIDIGGTTTDLSIFIDQEPLFKPKGIKIANHNSSIRGLYTESIGCGGDSLVQIENNSLKIGPTRKGPAAALGGNYPTPTDALIVLDEMQLGNRKQSFNSLKPLAKELNISMEALAKKIVTKFCKQIKRKIAEITDKLKSQPVYTINELLTDYSLDFDQIVGIGGPAPALIPKLSAELDLSYTIPKHSKTANAVGAALARKTKECTLYADTKEGYYHIPQLGVKEKVDPNFNLKKAKQIAINNLKKEGFQQQKIEITNQQSFNLVRGFYTTGKILEVTAQIKPGLEAAICKRGVKKYEKSKK